jgi:hypothetical protein
MRGTKSEVQKLFLSSRSHTFGEVCDELIGTTCGIKLSGTQNKRKDDDSRNKMNADSRSSFRVMLLVSVKIACCDRGSESGYIRIGWRNVLNSVWFNVTNSPVSTNV